MHDSATSLNPARSGQPSPTDDTPAIQQQLETIRARLAAVPAGPWEVWPNTHGDPTVVEAGRGPFRTIANCTTRTEDYGRAIAQLIAAGPTDLEWMLGLCDSLLAENARLRTGAS